MFKIVFILFFQGDQLRTRVKKICEGLVGVAVGIYMCVCVCGVCEE